MNSLPGPPAKKSWKIGLAIAVAVVLTAAAVLVVVGAPPAPVRVVSVTLAPAAPQPGETLTVTAEADGGGPFAPLSVNLQYWSLFGAPSGGGTMRSVGGNRYQAEMGPFDDGSEVWFVAAAAAGSGPPVLSEHHTVQIGTVLRGGPSGLAISEAAHLPDAPDPLDTVVVRAQVTSAANVTEVFLHHAGFRAGGSSSGSGYMTAVGPGSYESPLGVSASGPGGTGFERGTLYVYRVAVVDATGNTAVSEVRTFIIA